MRVVFSAIVALALAVCLELGSTIVLYAFGGKLYSPGSARAERQTVLRQAQRLSNDAARPTEEQPAPKARGEDGDWPPEVVHPFLGFVRDPTFEGARFKLNALGFYDSPAPPGRPPSALPSESSAARLPPVWPIIGAWSKS